MKVNLRKALCRTLSAAAAIACLPADCTTAFAQGIQEIQTQSANIEISLEEFSRRVSCLAENDAESASGSGITLSAESGDILIGGEKADPGEYGAPVMSGETMMADARVFELIDENASVGVSDKTVVIETQNGDAVLEIDQNSAEISGQTEELSQNVVSNGESALVPIGEIAQGLGYEVEENGGELTMYNPFATARLIVKSNGEIDLLNSVDSVEGFMDLHVLQFETSADAYEAYKVYALSDNVEYVQPSQYYSVDETEYFSADSSGTHNSWGADVMDVDSFNAVLSESGRDEQEVIVAVVDSGIDSDHPMFEGRLADTGVDFTSTNINGEDDVGHGTHVSGIICDLTLDNVKILPVKVLNSAGRGTDEQIFAGIYYAIEYGADVINLSLGGFGYSELYDEAVKLANQKGTVLCAAAGNDSIDTYRTIPGCCDGIITVSALDSDMTLAYYSNYGDEIEFAAPGTAILSSYPDGQYAYCSGTSMAAPHVSAAAAMLKSYDSSLTSQQIENALAYAAEDLGEAGRDELYGYGAVCFTGMTVLEEKCEAPEFSLAEGSYDGSVTLEISTKTAGAEIYYTLNGELPTKENAELYTGAFEISETAKICAKAFCDGKYDSEAARSVYIIGNTESESFYTVSDGVIVGYDGVLSDIIIPESIGGSTVYAISAAAFSGNSQITSVYMGGNITEIAADAFADCTALRSVEANSVTTVGDGAFSDCALLERAELSSLEEVPADCFSGCTALESIELASAVSIGAGAFRGCTSLKYAKLSKARSIGESAFSQCTSLLSTELDFENLSEIADYAFYMCTSLSNEFLMPNLQSIGQSAFFGCRKIENVLLSDEIVQIPENCFAYCGSLKFLAAANVSSVGDGAFLKCQTIKTNIDIDSLTSQTGEAVFEKAEYDYSAQSIGIAENETLTAQNGIEAVFDCTLGAVYYIELCAAVLPEFYIIGDDGEEASVQVLEESCSKYIFSVQFEADKSYTIYAASLTSLPFSVRICSEQLSAKTDIAQAEFFCGDIFSDTKQEDVEISATYNETKLAKNTDYRIVVSGNAVTVFGLGDFCGCIRLYPKVTKRMLLSSDCNVDSNFGQSEFVFTPERSTTYYFYALYTPDEFAEYLENKSGLTARGQIYSSSGDMLYSSQSCMEGDCYSYTFFYIEAYLEAGEDYRLVTDTVGKTKGSYSIRITDISYQLFDADIVVDTSIPATGGEVFADVEVSYYGEELVCGEDYVVFTKNNIKPGYADVYILGLNDYFGISTRRFTITLEDYTAIAMTDGETASFSLSGSDTAVISVTADEEATYRITFDCESTIRSYFRHSSTGLSYQYEKNTVEMSFRAGEYVIMFYAADNSAAEISVKVEKLKNISAASVYVSNVTYKAGVVQTPTITVLYGMSVLTLNEDYTLQYIANTPLPGVHYFRITGIGSYTGTLNGSYNVALNLSTSSAQRISEGTHTVDITTAGSYKAFRFTAPSDGDYLLCTEELENVALVVLDSGLNIVSSNCAPMGYGAEFSMTSGDVMYIAAMYYNPEKTGSWDFEITSDYALLSDTDITFESEVEFYNDGKTLPEVEFSYDGYTLVEGVDYEYFYSMGAENYGSAMVCYTGLGKYKFNAYIDYTLVMPMENIVKNSIVIELDRPQLFNSDYGNCAVYEFCAPLDGYYDFSQLSVIDNSFVQFYDENGLFQRQRSIVGGNDYDTRFFLKENETMYMLVGYSMCMNFDSYSGFIVRVSCQSTNVSKEIYYENGITYTVFKYLGYAVVSGADSDIENAQILSEVGGLSVTQINAKVFNGCYDLQTVSIPDSVTEIGAGAFEGIALEKIFIPKTVEIIGYRAFAQTDIQKLCILGMQTQLCYNSVESPSIVYGYENCLAQSYCDENGVEFVLLSQTLGDVNGDGKINAADASIIARAALNRLTLDLDMLLLCDVNGDGIINAIDATLVARYSVGKISEFPAPA